jgi:hypothetical protein
VKRFRHPELGEIEYEHAAFTVESAPELRLVVCTPLPGKSARKAQALFKPPRQAR